MRLTLLFLLGGLAVALVSMLLLVFGSVAVLGFEQGAEGANIKTPGDALWWDKVASKFDGWGAPEWAEWRRSAEIA